MVILVIIVIMVIMVIMAIMVILVLTLRSAAYIKMGQFTKAHQDAVKAKELNSEWAKVRCQR